MSKSKVRKSPVSINEKYINVDFSDFPEITDKIRKVNMGKIFTGSVRISRGIYRTSAETKEYIENSMKRKLP